MAGRGSQRESEERVRHKRNSKKKRDLGAFRQALAVLPLVSSASLPVREIDMIFGMITFTLHYIFAFGETFQKLYARMY